MCVFTVSLFIFLTLSLSLSLCIYIYYTLYKGADFDWYFLLKDFFSV